MEESDMEERRKIANDYIINELLPEDKKPLHELNEKPSIYYEKIMNNVIQQFDQGKEDFFILSMRTNIMLLSNILDKEIDPSCVIIGGAGKKKKTTPKKKTAPKKKTTPKKKPGKLPIEGELTPQKDPSDQVALNPPKRGVEGYFDIISPDPETDVELIRYLIITCLMLTIEWKWYSGFSRHIINGFYEAANIAGELFRSFGMSGEVANCDKYNPNYLAGPHGSKKHLPLNWFQKWTPQQIKDCSEYSWEQLQASANAAATLGEQPLCPIPGDLLGNELGRHYYGIPGENPNYFWQKSPDFIPPVEKCIFRDNVLSGMVGNVADNMGWMAMLPMLCGGGFILAAAVWCSNDIRNEYIERPLRVIDNRTKFLIKRCCLRNKRRRGKLGLDDGISAEQYKKELSEIEMEENESSQRAALEDIQVRRRLRDNAGAIMDTTKNTAESLKKIIDNPKKPSPPPIERNVADPIAEKEGEEEGEEEGDEEGEEEGEEGSKRMQITSIDGGGKRKPRTKKRSQKRKPRTKKRSQKRKYRTKKRSQKRKPRTKKRSQKRKNRRSKRS